MEKKEIEKNIKQAVTVFEDSLRLTYLDKETPFYGIGVHRLLNFFTGKVSQNRKKDGSLRISGDLAKVMFNHSCEGLPMKFEDWDIFPLVITLLHIPPEEEQ